MTPDDTRRQERPEEADHEELSTAPEDVEQWIRPGDVAAMLSVSKRTVFRWIADPDSGLVSRKPSPGILLVSRTSLAAFIDAGRV